MTSHENATIRETVAPVVEAAGLFLEECELTGEGGTRTLRVLVDLPEGTESLDLDGVAAVAREISDALDREDPVPGPPYELEVSTPGATRTLETPRHWRRNVGRLVRVRPLEASATPPGCSRRTRTTRCSSAGTSPRRGCP